MVGYATSKEAEEVLLAAEESEVPDLSVVQTTILPSASDLAARIPDGPQSDYDPYSDPDERLPSSQATEPDIQVPRTPEPMVDDSEDIIVPCTPGSTPEDEASRQLQAIEAELSQIDNTLKNVDVSMLGHIANASARSMNTASQEGAPGQEDEEVGEVAEEVAEETDEGADEEADEGPEADEEPDEEAKEETDDVSEVEEPENNDRTMNAVLGKINESRKRKRESVGGTVSSKRRLIG
jgi:hypothetical protein